jgi:Flp pilus assembly protein TadB
MRLFLFLAVFAVVGLVVTGAIKMQKSADSGKISIEVDKQKVRDDAQIVIDKGEELLHGAETALENAAHTQPR